MGTEGIHSLTAGEALNVQLGFLGFDEVDFTEHLTNGSTVESDEWGMTNDLHNNSGTQAITLVTPGANLQALYEGEMLEALQLIVPANNRTISGGHNWTNVDLTNYHFTAGRLWTNASSAGLSARLAPAYVPMTAGTVYNLSFDLGQGGTVGTWEVQDYAGNALPTTAASVDGASLAYIRANSSKSWSFQFTAPSGTSGGLKLVSSGGAANQFWDNFAMTAYGATAVAVGLVFRVGGSVDTTDTALYTAKGDVAPAEDDLFAVTGIGAHPLSTCVYVGNAVGSYAFSAASVTSALTQTAANRDSAGLNAKGTASKEYALTYTVAIKEAIAPAGSLAVTLETFGASTTMPITADEHTIYFKSATGAATADLVIQSVSSSSMTAGVLAFSDLSLRRCCDNANNAAGVSWWKAKAIRGAATFSATAINGDDLRSDELAENVESDPGIFSRIEGTAGVIRAFRVPHRVSDV